MGLCFHGFQETPSNNESCYTCQIVPTIIKRLEDQIPPLEKMITDCKYGGDGYGETIYKNRLETIQLAIKIVKETEI